MNGGVAFVRKQRILMATITLDLFAVLFGGATMLMPVSREGQPAHRSRWTRLDDGRTLRRLRS